jgi:hypothetical protein
MYLFPWLAPMFQDCDCSQLFSEGVHAMKFQEGQYNKAFLLKMDNGSEVVAKIPNPNAGPAHYATASEVATVDFVCSALLHLS